MLPAVLSAQDGKILHFPKSTAKPVYTAPMRPVTHLADLKAKHRGEKTWQERLVDDGNSVGVMIQDAPGTKSERHLFADSPAWWAVVEGRIRFEIEKTGGGFEVIDASTGSFVYAPERMLHSLEIVGPEPAIRYEVTVGPAVTPVYEKKPNRASPGIEFIPVTLSTGPNPLDVRNQGASDGKPWPVHINVYDVAKERAAGKNFTIEAMRANRARGNLICGYPAAGGAAGDDGRGHLHSNTAESWIVMLGELRWTFDGDETSAIVARQGDLVYGPPGTFHEPQFWGKAGLNCRLTQSTMPSLNHFYDAPR